MNSDKIIVLRKLKVPTKNFFESDHSATMAHPFRTINFELALD